MNARPLLGVLALCATLADGTGCSFDTAFACSDDEQCALRAEGSCEVRGWCAYPSDACASGRAFGPYAPPEFADACVEPSGGSSSSSGSSGAEGDASTTDGMPAAVCGNGILEVGESCDDGNETPDDGCHPLCVELYTEVWTIEPYDTVADDDRGFALAVDASAEAIYVAGRAVTDSGTADMLVQRYGLADGSLRWTWTRDDGGDDRAEQVAVDAMGNVVVGGVLQSIDEDERAWVGTFDPEKALLWEHEDVLGSKAEAVAVTTDGRIVAVGRAGPESDSQAWIQRFTAGGEREGAPILQGDAADNRGIDVIATPGGGFQVTGSLTVDGSGGVWTARYDGAGALEWEDHIPGGGPYPRGVGQALHPTGGSAVGGVLDSDLFVQFFDDLGARAETFREGSNQHDEVADVVFLPDGRYVVVGFLGFTSNGTASSDGWVRFNTPDGEEIVTYTISGTGGGADKLLAVDTAPHSVVITGYVTNEGTGVDVWLRRYAI